MPDDNPTSPSTPTFADLSLPPALAKAIEEVGYETPTPIQQAAIPPLLAGKDVLGQAQTGTGKTAAFALPLLARVDLEHSRPQILVLTPTRELAIQVAEAMQTYARHLRGFRVLPIYGGQSLEPQLRRLSRGTHAVVGTPGRVLDHLRRGTLKLQALSALVLDEADEMLRMGFQEEVEAILSQTPEKKQVALFSATMPAPIRKVARQHQNKPVEIEIAAKTATVATVTQRYWKAVGANKLDALTRILEAEAFDAMLVFVRTRNSTAQLSERLNARGFRSAPLSGEMSQSLRERTIEQLKRGTLDILVATDVAARGLDVERISHVINFDVPWDTEAYIHRIGRTGRAGREGQAILFVNPRERRMLFAIEKATGQRLEPMHLPSRRDISERRIEQFKEAVANTLASQDLALFEQLVGDIAEAEEVTPKTVAAALVHLVQKERPLLPQHPRRDGPKERRDAPKERRETGRPSFGQGQLQGWGTYRLEVGRDHGALPKNIIGAVANEGGFAREHLGRLTIHDRHSLIDLPKDLPTDLLAHLGKVQVMGQELRIAPAGFAPGKGKAAEGPRGGPKTPRKPSPGGKGSRKPYGQKPAGKGKPGAKAAGKAAGKAATRAPGKPDGPSGSKRPRAAAQGEAPPRVEAIDSPEPAPPKNAFSSFAQRKAKKKAVKKAKGQAKKIAKKAAKKGKGKARKPRAQGGKREPSMDVRLRRLVSRNDSRVRSRKTIQEQR